MCLVCLGVNEWYFECILFCILPGGKLWFYFSTNIGFCQEKYDYFNEFLSPKLYLCNLRDAITPHNVRLNIDLPIFESFLNPVQYKIRIRISQVSND